MNELQSRYGNQGFVVLGFPCNQFGYQENIYNEEILNSLKYVRPGNGFEPNFSLSKKMDVNGEDENPVFTFLKQKLPKAHDNPETLMVDPKFIIWKPVCRNDIGWNFEKFLIGPDGEPYRRYSKNFLTIDIEEDIRTLLQNNKRPHDDKTTDAEVETE
ncbi:glutathione peroxidase 1-like isoform X1 [Narcine bancroftii]